MENGKRLFELLDEMNVEDGENKTELIAVSPNFISAEKIKGGAKISMGVEERFLMELINDRYMPVLLLIDKKEYFKRAK